jgi:hypothetical protein
MSRLLLLALASWLLAGCAIGTSRLDELGSAGELEQGCEALLDSGAEPLAIGTIQGTSRYVLDTSRGRCVDDGDDLVASLRRHDHASLVDQLTDALESQDEGSELATDPSPHPDVPDHLDPLRTDPSPHPDMPPHVDSEDDEEAAVIIIWVVVADDDSDGDMTTDSRPRGK